MALPEQFSQMESALRASAEELIAGRGGEVGSAGSGEPWERALARLTLAAAESVPGASYAGMTMRAPDGGLEWRAPSHEAIVDLDRTQADLGEGPCVDALTPDGAAIVLVDDVADESRWPRFVAAATRAGIGSMLSYSLVPRSAATGALNFYATTAHAFADPASRAVAGAFAMQASIAVYGARRITNLSHALTTRDLIGQAKGILMERRGLDDQQAFDLLVRSSQDTNMKVVEVARWLCHETTDRTGGAAHVRGRAS